MNTLAMVEQVMRQTKTAMSVKDIVEIAGDSLPTRSKTPETVVARDLSMNIKKLGEASLFVRVAPGRYTMREFVEGGIVTVAPLLSDCSKNSDEATPVLSQALKHGPAGVLPVATPALKEAPAAYWRRDLSS